MESPERGRVTPAELVAEALRGTAETVAVTGATGWFGAVALDLLYAALGDDAPARVTGYASTAREVAVADGRTVSVRPLAELVSQEPAPATLLHLAFLTRDKVASLGVDSYTRQNLAISATVLDAIAKHQPRRVIVASSGAVYSSTGRLASDVDADPYGALKHLDELAFRAATRDVGGTCVIPRVFSVAGPRMTKPGLYALGSMIQMATTGGPIEIRASGPVYRSYCGVDEVLALAFWAAYARREVIFDSGGTVVEMADLARTVASVHGLGDDDVLRNWDPAGVESRYVGDGRLMDELAAEAGLTLRSLPDLVRATSSWLATAAQFRSLL